MHLRSCRRPFAWAGLAAVLLAGVLGCAPAPVQGVADPLDDSAITANVRAAILKEPALKSADIKVETYDGAVQLSGVLANQEAIYRAVKATRTVEGVRAVRNHLRLEQE